MAYNFKYCIFLTPVSIKTISFPSDEVSDTGTVLIKATNLASRLKLKYLLKIIIKKLQFLTEGLQRIF